MNRNGATGTSANRKALERRRALIARLSPSDPFGERSARGERARFNVLGGTFTVDSTDTAALRLVVDAFGGLPPHRLKRKRRHFRVRIAVTDHRPTWPSGHAPPRPTLAGHDGLLCATVDAGNFAVVDVPSGRAFVSLSPGMLRHPYHARYELIEFAFVTLASRAQSLVPLHAACVGLHGAACLLMGPSGAGKSTLALHALSNGLRLLAEDSAFVDLDDLRVTGSPNFLHVRPSALALLSSGPVLAEIRRSPIIERRSGARKYEVDVRKLPGKIATAPLRLAATVFLSRRQAAPQNALTTIGSAELLSRLRREQPYAAALPNWPTFERRIRALPAYELRRTARPDAPIALLHMLLNRRQRS